MRSTIKKSNITRVHYCLEDIIKMYGEDVTERTDGYVLYIVLTGTATLKIKEQTFALHSETGFLIGAQETYCLKASATFHCYRLQIRSMYSLMDSSPKHILERHLGSIDCKPFSHCLDLLDALYEQRDTEEELVYFQNDITLHQLLLFIFRCNQRKAYDQSKMKTIADTLQYIHQYYYQPISIDHLAAMINRSRWQYTRIFKEQMGKVPTQYINQVRIERAKQLLLTTNSKMHLIADNVGYSNEYYFNRRFKESVGVTPGQYRRYHRKHVRVFAPYLEDFLLALDIIPVAQSYHASWGKQDYLNLPNVPAVDIRSQNRALLAQCQPDFILMEDGIERWVPIDWLQALAPTYKLPHPGERWRETLRTIADLLGYTEKAEAVITAYEMKAALAKQELRLKLEGETVAFLRISAQEITLYAGPEYGYTGPILYKDLGLPCPNIVKQLAPGRRRVDLTRAELACIHADHIFITIDNTHQKPIRLFEEPVWQTLSAVQSGQVYEVDFFTWMNYGVLSHMKKIDDVLRVFS